MNTETVAQDILSQIRTTIVMNMRFMDMAVFRLRTVPEKITLATDGNCLYYNPIWLIFRYKKESNAAIRDYLHVLMHCVFRHPFVHSLIDHSLWNLACDIAAEKMICDFKCKYFSTEDEIQKQTVIAELENKVHPLTAEKLYNYFQDHQPDARWAKLFGSDNHEIWYNRQKAQTMARNATRNIQRDRSSNNSNTQTKSTDQNQNNETPLNTDPPGNNPPDNKNHGNSDSKESNSQNENLNEDNRKNKTQSSSSSAEGNLSKENHQNDNPQTEDVTENGTSKNSAQNNPFHDESSETDQSLISLENEWRDISDHIQLDLESFGKQRGENAGSLQQMLNQINREKYDYESFLIKFAVLGEVMKINDDEFDYIFYTYGLKLFENMPLIEPLEYKEVKRIREFVIAIDTSGSTSGKLVQTFLNKTWNILQSTESFFSKVNIHIIQCDAELQEAVKITTKEEFEEYIRNLTIRGLGGTDFRPVFTYVDQLIQQKEFRNLKGLIYFTDGVGVFPEKMPQYQTAFVFIQDEFNNVNVPPWAIKLILEKDEL